MARSCTVEDQLTLMAHLVPGVRLGSVPDLHQFEVMESSLMRNAHELDRDYIAHRIRELRCQFAKRASEGTTGRSAP